VLSRFARYLEKGWDFPTLIRSIRDNRLAAQIPASSVFLSTFGLFAVRLPSFNALEQELKIPARWEPWIGAAKPSADTLGYSLARFDLERLRDNLARIAHQAKRKKALHRFSQQPTPYWGAAFDGHELWASFNRCCDKCLTREIDTVQGPVTQYYHRVVVLQMVDVTPALILDIEPLLPGEGEVVASLRILERLPQRYPRFLDFITADALYLQAPFIHAVRKQGLHAIVVLKQENRDLYKDVDGLLAITPLTTVLNTDGTSTWRWDLENLTTWSQLDGPIRVVRTVEEKEQRRRIARQWVVQWETVEWRWATTFPAAVVSGDWIARWGHARWDIENRGFNELSQHWAMDHCFHHHPTAILAILLILAMAFALTTFFFDRNLKPAIRQGKTRLHLASLLADDLLKSATGSFWAQPP
jgi:hypothetical protein